MKQKDIALVIVIVFVSGALSFFISNKFISSPEHTEKTAKIDPITPDFKEPNPAYFNSRAINPTQLIRIQDNSNDSPFNER